ncbi:hypothetical protein QA612_20950 [Evansella sp. AB-P1]|uniref:hypothetical protein n=1 Tax=Evansella sp. AB-P1 TaxID=3037653 RepID=UPI0024201CA2|nr:hypothetical protein [Evansella sp. AB-P1]MDG5789929.1 hypothetical protein [Evansella sp. AB-P1]
MTSKKAIITTLQKEQFCKIKLPITKENSYTFFTLKGEANHINRHTIPCNWTTISSLFHSYDQIILHEPLLSNDQMVQGIEKHVSECIRIIFQRSSILLNKPLYYLRDGTIIPLHNEDPSTKISKHNFQSSTSNLKHAVTSVQKIYLSSDIEMKALVLQYFQWLHHFTKKMIVVKKSYSSYSFHVLGIKQPLLILEYNKQLENHHDIAELVIKGGFLNKEAKKQEPVGRFWFVRSLHNNNVYTCLVHFKPALPWYIYRMTQGWIHGRVMNQFTKFLLKNERNI